MVLNILQCLGVDCAAVPVKTVLGLPFSLHRIGISSTSPRLCSTISEQLKPFSTFCCPDRRAESASFAPPSINYPVDFSPRTFLSTQGILFLASNSLCGTPVPLLTLFLGLNWLIGCQSAKIPSSFPRFFLVRPSQIRKFHLLLDPPQPVYFIL